MPDQRADTRGTPGRRLQLLDSFRLTDRDVEVPTSLCGRRLLAFLALTGPASRAVAAGRLWPEVAQDHALGSLRTTLWRLQRQVPGLVRRQSDTVGLAGAITVDVWTFTRLLGRVLDPAEHLDVVDEATVIGRGGELLPGWDEDWVVFERERLGQRWMHALEVLAARLVRQGRHARALDAALLCVRLQPLRESAHRAVVAVHLAEHNVGEAVRHYEQFRALLRDELAIEPSTAFTELLPASTLAQLSGRPRTAS